MEREIKFRAWDKVIERFGYWDPESNLYEAIFWSLAIGEKMPIEEYTGYKCKAGKDIYEGDIIRELLDDPSEEIGYTEWIAEIRFERGCWVVCQIGFDYTDKPFSHFTRLHDVHDGIEVVGNIHEKTEEK